MVRTIVIPENKTIQVSVPEAYIGRQAEITCLALDELEQKPIGITMADFFGTLSERDYESLKLQTEQARGEWDRDI